MTRDEWIARFLDRYRALGGPALLRGVAPAGPDDLDIQIAEGAAGEQTELHGASGLAWELPEDVAEREAQEDGECSD